MKDIQQKLTRRMRRKAARMQHYKSTNVDLKRMIIDMNTKEEDNKGNLRQRLIMEIAQNMLLNEEMDGIRKFVVMVSKRLKSYLNAMVMHGVNGTIIGEPATEPLRNIQERRECQQNVDIVEEQQTWSKDEGCDVQTSLQELLQLTKASALSLIFTEL